MYMRLVQARYKPYSVTAIRQIFEVNIIPRLQALPGCICVCLIKSDRRVNEGMSMTLWDTKDHADDYERSGLFNELLEKVKPYLSDSSEWKLELSTDLKLEYRPVPEEPVITSYHTLAQVDSKLPDHEIMSTMYLRVFSIRVRPGEMTRLKNVYEEEIVPRLHEVKGCRYAFLTENAREENEAISVTIWDSKKHADAYEEGLIFDSLKKKIEHTFAEVYQWKAALQKEYRGRVVTSDDPELGSYQIVTGKVFR